MSCPDWRTLRARRDDELVGHGPAAGESAWAEALEHLETCGDCTEAALDADPLLMFRRLPAPDLGASAVDDMKQAVAAMRRTERIERPRGGMHHLLRAAALGGLMLGAGLIQGAAPGDARLEVAELDPSAANESVAAPAAVQDPAAAAALAKIPLVETADPAFGSIIQVVSEDIALIIVPPEVGAPSGLDV